MFGHQQGLGVREIENLPGGMVGDHSLVEGAAAAGTGLGQMIDGGIGGGWSGAVSCRDGPAVRRPSCRFSHAGWRCGQASSAHHWRGLAAVGAVPAKPVLQFGDARMQDGQRGGMMHLSRQNQRDEVALRKLAERGVFHRLLRI